MKQKKSIKYIFFIVCVYILTFQNLLQRLIVPVKYFDELLALFSLFWLCVYVVKKKLKVTKYGLYMFITLCILIITGLYSSFKYNYQPIWVVFSDVLLLIKFFLVYTFIQAVYDNLFLKEYKKNIAFHAKIIIYIFLILTILNIIFKLWPVNIFRFGLMANQLFYSHPTVLASTCVFLISIVILTESDEKTQYINILILLLILATTLRFKAIGVGVIIILMLLYFRFTDKKISLWVFGILALCAIFIAWNQINIYYFKLDGSARKMLTLKSIEIARDYFPGGTGFGTFGSYFSSVVYSPIYGMYGLSNIYGLQQGNTSFVNDTFWPMILGQFGVLGLLAYIILLIMIYLKIQKSYANGSKDIYIAQMVAFIYLLISSTSESAFVNPLAISFAMIIGINNLNKKETE